MDKKKIELEKAFLEKRIQENEILMLSNAGSYLEQINLEYKQKIKDFDFVLNDGMIEDITFYIIDIDKYDNIESVKLNLKGTNFFNKIYNNFQASGDILIKLKSGESVYSSGIFTQDYFLEYGFYLICE